MSGPTAFRFTRAEPCSGSSPLQRRFCRDAVREARPARRAAE